MEEVSNTKKIVLCIIVRSRKNVVLFANISVDRIFGLRSLKYPPQIRKHPLYTIIDYK